MTTDSATSVGNSALNQGITLETMQLAARRRIRRAAFTLAAAVVAAVCGLTWFVATFASMGVGLVVAWIAAYKLVAGAAAGLSAARASARWLLPVVALLATPYTGGCPGDWGDPVPAARHTRYDPAAARRAARRPRGRNRSAAHSRAPAPRAREPVPLGYWPRLAELEEQRRRAEADCRAASLRSEAPMTRVAPLPPPPGPITDDPFAPPTWQQPSGYPPPATYPAYPRYPDVNGSDPFSQPAWRQPSGYPPPARYPVPALPGCQRVGSVFAAVLAAAGISPPAGTRPAYPEVDSYDPFSGYPPVERRRYPRSRVRTYPPYAVWNGQR